ncbi:DNA polymerase delta subunit 4 [Geosmithia morbida]|uniref:DNA polymerase delta subunit 4 n=1 Tax=Geosmithia morbida TaxID=1094350 RepID=A0A9P4Z482_9HYPO|nr:DNA polymerase delta subunit 4 [Geosmithia morbida]KAF4126344.1 DNA polymerase delta subunit 4 [Geosmithia morbida]
MPTPRAYYSRGPGKHQSTLSFHTRVSKNVAHDVKGKNTTSIPNIPTRVDVEPPHDDDVAVDILSKHREEPKEKEEEEEEEEEEEATKEEVELPRKSEAVVRAENVTDKAIEQYWRAIEKERIAPRVHQGDLGRNEKILRYFDVSSRYGPCIGMSRMRRWERAERLGLNPPVEVLAVLLREDEAHAKGVQTSHMEKLMGATAVGSNV